MKFHLRWAATALFVVVSGVSSASNAALVDRGGGLIYDTDLNITWLADANYAKTSGYDADGIMSWSEARIWAGNLSYGGYTDWRLPITVQPDANCALTDGNGQTYGMNCTGGEMGHLFYNELGGVSGTPIGMAHNANYDLFANIGIQVSGSYWYDTEYEPNTVAAWGLSFWGGAQGTYQKEVFVQTLAWAVRSGDVATVPVPAAAWLLGSGFLGLLGVTRRRKAA